MQMQQNNMQMQQNVMRQSNHFCFFTKNNPRKMKADRNAIKYFDEVHSSYLLDVSNKTGSIFMLNQKDLCVIDPKQLEEILNKNTAKKVYDEYDFGGEDPVELTMTRLSPCETLMAIVNPSNIVVIYLPDFLSQKEPKVETNFEINGHSYAYIEWPPLNDIYCAKKHFLTLDTSGKLRTHFISGDEMFSNLDEHFRCATFSVDGGLIYAINYHQELFIIDPLNVQIVSRRKIDDLQTTSTIVSIQMMQISPRIMVIGSLCKSLQDPIESSVPYIFLLSGDLLDANSKFNVAPFPMHLSQAIKPERLPDFRFHYVKERQLLLFSHTESSRVQALQLDENGDLAELDSIDLDGASMRGFVFYRGTFSREEKQQMVQVEYQNRRFALPNGPRIFVLDSEGFMHHFNYYDTRYVLHNQSILMDPMKVEVLRGLRAVPAIIANRSIIPPSSPRGGLQSNGMMMGGNNNMMNGGGGSSMMMGNNNNNTNPFGLGQLGQMKNGGGGGMGEESGNDQALKMKKPRMTDDDDSKRNTQGGGSLLNFPNQQTNNNPFPNMMGGANGMNNNGGMMGGSNMMNNNSNIDGRGLRSGTMMPPKVNIVPPQQTQMPTGNGAMPPSVRDLMNQRKIHKLGQMNQMGGGLQEGNNNVNPNLNQTANTPTFTGGISQQNQVNPFASQQQNQKNPVNPFASQQNNMMNNNGMSSNLPTPILTNQQSFNPNQQQGNNSMPPPQSMGNNFQSNLQNKPVNPFASQQQQQQNNIFNPQQRNIGMQNQQQNNNGMQQGSQMGNSTMPPNTLQFQSQSQGAQGSLNPNINPNAQNSLQQQQQGMQQGNGELHFQQQQQQPNMMMNNQGQVYTGPTAEHILAERIREQEEIVKKNKSLFAGISNQMRKAGTAFDEAKDLFPQRRKELLHWLKRQKVRDFGNLKRIYKQFFDDSSALDLELILLGQELDAKVNIINDVKQEDAHSKILKNLMTEAQKKNRKLDNHMGIGQRYLENQEKILSVTPGLEPRKIEYRETDGAETIQFFSQGGGSKLGKSSLTKSFKQSLAGQRSTGGFGQQKERIDIFGDENINPKTANFPRFDKTYEHRKRATEEKWMKVQEISNAIFEERGKDVGDIAKRLRKAKKQHTAKQREAEVSKKKIIFFDLSEDSSDESDEIKAAVDQENKDSNETLVKPQVSYEKIDKFFSQILMDLSSKYHFDEILQSSHHKSYDYSSSQEAKPKNNLLNRPSYSKLHEPSIQTTSNTSMNDLLLRVRNAKRRELDRPLISADVIQEEKQWIKRAEAELEEERLAMEARRKMEEMEAEAAAALAKKRAAEEAERQKREMEAQKRAQEARLAQEQMMQRKAQEEAKKQEQKPPSSGPVQTQLQFQKPPVPKENPPATGNQPKANENKSKKPAGEEKTTGNPALDDTIVIDDNDDKNQEETAPGGNILPADILGNNTGGEDPFIKELIGNAQMSQGEVEVLKKAKAVAMAIKQQVLNARLNPEEAAFIVTLKGIPKNWNDDMLKHRLMQMQRRFETLKVEPEKNTALLRVMGLRDAIRLYILNEQNIDGFVIQAEIKISQKQKGSGPVPGPGPGIGGGIGIGPGPGAGPGANISVSTGGNIPQGYPMQGRTIRTITNPFPSNPSMNNQQQQQQQMGGQPQQMGGNNVNRFQTNPNAINPNQNMNPQQQSFPSPGPRFGQSTGMGQSPAFGQPGFGQGNSFMTSPSLGGRAFGAPPMKFGQTSMPSPGLNNQGGMNQGGFGGFGGQGQGQGQNQQFMGFQGAVQQNQMQGNGGFMGGQNPGNSAADFFGAPRR